MSRIAVFLDRDGTITREVGYVNHVDRLELEAGVVEGLRELQQHELLLVVVTNQAGAARGLFPLSLIDVINDRMAALLSQQGVQLDGVYCCPHHPTVGDPPLRQDCVCRKPKPGLLHRAAQEMDLDIGKSYFIGDKASDIECAQRAGAKGILVLTGYGKGECVYHLDGLPEPPAAVCGDLREAAYWILCDLGYRQPAFSGR